jgi:hypothetical protein
LSQTSFCRRFKDLLRDYICIIDCESLQGDINSLVNWWNVNHLILNIEKCTIMTFSRTLSPISNKYKIGDVLLSRKESVDDLGILFDKGLSFVDHINSITSTAFKNLGYIYRNCTSFRDIACWKLLFFCVCNIKARILFTYLVPNIQGSHKPSWICSKTISKNFNFSWGG